MARGQVLTLTTGTARLIESETGGEMESVAVLNPNDGVVYLKLNGPAGPTSSQWDWKLPSQSYGLFPGPWVSLGLYYLDQSGSGRNGELNVYSATNKLYTPVIGAIGRAVQQAGSTMDISTGTIPQNPPAGSARLWVDGSGNLHLLQANGTDQQEIDSNDPQMQALGGVLSGTLPNPQFSTGPIDVPALIRTTGLGNYNSGAGAGIELYYSGGAGVIQVYDRGAGAVIKQLQITAGPLILQSNSGNLSLGSVGNCVINPNGVTQIYRPDLNGSIVTHGNPFDTIYSNDWIRPLTAGQGIYNNANGQGVGIGSSGAYDYSGGALFLTMPKIAAGQITNWWGNVQAPGGSIASGTPTFMPGVFGSGLTCSGFSGGRMLITGQIHVGSSQSGLSGYITLYVNGASQMVISNQQFAGGGAQMMPFTYVVNYNWGANPVIQLAWWTGGGGTMSMNTSVYSQLAVYEFIK